MFNAELAKRCDDLIAMELKKMAGFRFLECDQHFQEYLPSAPTVPTIKEHYSLR